MPLTMTTAAENNNEWQEQELLDLPLGHKSRRKVSGRTHSYVALENQESERQLFRLDTGGGCNMGVGGYGHVKRAQDADDNVNPVKISHPEGSNKGVPLIEKAFRLFNWLRREARDLNEYELSVLRALGRIIASGVIASSGKYYAVMQDQGIPLNSYIEQHKATLTEDEALSLAEKVIQATHDFHNGAYDKHKQHRLHNDLKPDNVMIKPDTLDASLIDFGEAFDIPDDKISPFIQYQHPRRISADPFVIAPEIWAQARSICLHHRVGPARRFYSRQSDVYSLSHCLDKLADFSPPVKKISCLMRHRNPFHRPTTGLLLTALKVLQNKPATDLEKAQTACLMISDKKNCFYDPRMMASLSTSPDFDEEVRQLADGLDTLLAGTGNSRAQRGLKSNLRAVALNLLPGDTMAPTA